MTNRFRVTVPAEHHDKIREFVDPHPDGLARLILIQLENWTNSAFPERLKIMGLSCNSLIRDTQGKFKNQALLCKDVTSQPNQIMKGYVLRWQREVTFREVREHLSVETLGGGT